MKKYNYQGIFDLIESCDSGMACINNEHLHNVLAPYQSRLNGQIKYRPISKETFDSVADVLQNGDAEIGLAYEYELVNHVMVQYLGLEKEKMFRIRL